jgi:O-antigen/teichoic acid export membrane protein
VNVVMLYAGYSLVQLVLVTTAIRIATYFVYRRNAYTVFPSLSLNPRRFLWSRVRELTGFSVYVSIIDWANKLNYSIDAIVIGAYLGASAVAIWTVPQRLAEMLQRLTNQFNGIIFPVVVDSDAGEKPEHLRMIFIEGTRLSLITVLPLAAALFLLADPLIRAWVGPKFLDSIVVTQILICVIAIRVGNATATTVLKGAGEHRMLAFTNAGSALANVALSLLWIRRFGLVGQAYGTLIPVAAASVVILWPAACRRVGIRKMDAFRRAIWPTLWPVVPMAMVVIPLRNALPAQLSSVALAGAVGAIGYLAVFLAFAVNKDERQVYLAKATEILRSHRRMPAAA